MRLTIKGIESNISGLNVENSSCDIINLRNRYGEWKSIKQTAPIITLGINSNKYYIHYLHDTKFYWGVDGNSVFRYNEDGTVLSTIIVLDIDEEFFNFLQFGVLMIVSTSKNVYYYRYIDSEYIKLDNLPLLNFAVEGVERDALNGSVTDVDPSTWDSRGKALIQEAINKAQNDGKTQGHTFFRIAYETSSGDYILPSAPLYRFLGSVLTSEEYPSNPSPNGMISFYSFTNNSPNTLYYKISGRYVKPMIKIKFTPSEIDVIKKYDGLITGISIFMSKPVLDVNYNKWVYDEILTGTPNYYTQTAINTDNINDIFENTKAFYKIGSLDMSDITAYNDLTLSVDNLETNEILPATISHTVIGRTVLDYNNRVHLANITTKLLDINNQSIDDNIESSHYHDNETIQYGDKDVWALVKLQINGVYKYVVTKYNGVYWYSSGPDGRMFLSPLITYPDTRAVSIQFLIYKGTYKTIGTPYQLRKHPFLNIAYHFKTATEYPNNESFSGTPVNSGIKFRIFQYYNISLSGVDPIIVSKSLYYKDTNRIQVSANGNPLVMLPDKSYRISTQKDTILSLATNAIALSAGQFGEYPLFAYTDNGVFALKQGNNVLYSSIVPVTRDVIQTNETISTSLGIIFINEKGVCLQQGSSVLVISDKINGRFVNPLINDSIFIKVVDGTYDTGHILSAITGNAQTLDYKSAAIGFDPINDEVYISFRYYTFVYNIHSKQWFKRSDTWDAFMIEKGNLIGVKGGEFSTVSQSGESHQSTNYLIITNPISIDNTLLKKYVEIKLPYQGENRTVNESLYTLAVYVYGSNNQQEWKLINGKRFRQTREITLKKVRVSNKFIMIVIKGNQTMPVIKDVLVSHS